ncbi:MAG: aminotransferase class IV [Planctomycetota bacterium]|nr:aminotransferase class IV [Planctomycetota bacterium]
MSVSSWPLWVDGCLVERDAPAIRADDQGFLLGLAVFDTLLHEEGCLMFVEEHVARLQRGARVLGIAAPRWEPFDALRSVADALDGRDAALRTTLSRGTPGRGPSLVVAARALEPPPAAGVTVAVSSLTKLADDPLERIKSTDRLRHVLAREEARRAGAWEALVATADGDVVEGTVSNLFAVVDGALRTAAESRGCLDGVVRGRILADLEREPLCDAAGVEVPVIVDRIERADLARAAEVFLTNSTGGVIPVTRVAGLAEELPGPAGVLTQAVRTRMRAIERRYREVGNSAGSRC